MQNETIEKTVKSNYDFFNKVKIYYQAKKKKNKKRSQEYYRNLSEEEKIKKEIMLTWQIKRFQRKRKKKRIYEKVLP